MSLFEIKLVRRPIWRLIESFEFEVVVFFGVVKLALALLDLGVLPEELVTVRGISNEAFGLKEVLPGFVYSLASLFLFYVVLRVLASSF